MNLTEGASGGYYIFTAHIKYVTVMLSIFMEIKLNFGIVNVR